MDITEEKQRRTAEADAIRETLAVWNCFGARVGSFADEQRTLALTAAGAASHPRRMEDLELARRRNKAL